MTPGGPAVIDEAEVVIVGAGPAGSRCAARLAEHGHEVLLLDKSTFPRDKPCGDGITNKSVRVLEELGLHTLLSSSQQVVGARAFFDHAPETKSYPKPARCISRLDLDQGLLDAALDRGVRFTQASVDGPLMEGEVVTGVSIKGADGAAVRARCVVAADGATSRLRRGCGFSSTTSGRRAYAVRQYFRSERPLAPYFDVFVPLLCDSEELFGYGWIFPLDEYTANVGVGYYRYGSSGYSPPLTTVLDGFVKELMKRQGDRYGTLESIDRPFGSPVGVGFKSELCQFQRILFVGDAAGMTDPLTGEGIGHALAGAAMAADVAHSALRGRAGAGCNRDLEIGREFDRRLLRLGQDTDVLRRLTMRRLHRSTDSPREYWDKVRGEPFLRATAYTIASSSRNPVLRDTPISSFVARHDAEAAEALDALNEKALDELQTRFPLAPETLHQKLRSDAGPVVGTMVLLAARAGGRGADPTVVSSALGVEFLGMFPAFVAQAVDRPSRETSKINNALAVLVADYVVSRALSCSASAGPDIAGAVASTGCSMCEAEAIERASWGDTNRPPEHYLEAARLRDGDLFALAATVGGLFGGFSPETVKMFGDYGQRLGVAFRISNDICHLLSGDVATRLQARRALQDGCYSLPVIEALSPGRSSVWLYGADLDATVSEIYRAGGPQRALVECEAMAETAREAIGSTGVGGAMADLCDLPVERAQVALREFGDRQGSTVC